MSNDLDAFPGECSEPFSARPAVRERVPASVLHLGLALGVALLLVVAVVFYPHRGKMPLHFAPQTGAIGIALLAAALAWIRCARAALREGRWHDRQPAPVAVPRAAAKPASPRALPAATHIDDQLWNAMRVAVHEEAASRHRAARPAGTGRAIRLRG